MRPTPELTALIGRPIEAVKDVLGTFGPPEVTRIEDETYHEFRGAGFSLTESSDSGEIVAAHMYPEGVDGYREFAGALPYALRFGEARHAVHARLGVPTAFGGGVSGTPSWERYDADRYSCHIEYLAGERVGLVTIMTPAVVPPLDLSGDRQ
jgi:hypothetical protein